MLRPPQVRWKGSLAPLRLMRKHVGFRSGSSALTGSADTRRRPRSKQADEFTITLDQVLSYRDNDAIVWFALLVARNSYALSPAYRLFLIVPIFLALASYRGFLGFMHS